MSYDYRGPGRAPESNDNNDRSRKGSVRAARERVRAKQTSRDVEPSDLLPQTQYVQPSRPGPAPQWSMSEYETSQNGQQMDAQPQWPLPVASLPETRRVPPQRPARGPDVPPMPANFYGNSQLPVPGSSLPRGGKGMSRYLGRSIIPARDYCGGFLRRMNQL